MVDPNKEKKQTVNSKLFKCVLFYTKDTINFFMNSLGLVEVHLQANKIKGIIFHW